MYLYKEIVRGRPRDHHTFLLLMRLQSATEAIPDRSHLLLFVLAVGRATAGLSYGTAE